MKSPLHDEAVPSDDDLFGRVDSPQWGQSGDFEFDRDEFRDAQRREAGVVEGGIHCVRANRSPERLGSDDVPDATPQRARLGEGDEGSPDLAERTRRGLFAGESGALQPRLDGRPRETQQPSPLIGIQASTSVLLHLHHLVAQWYRGAVIVKLPYGRDNVAVDLRRLKVRPLQSTAPRGVRDLGRLLSRAVDFPIEGEPLLTLARRSRSAVVVIPDATRRASLPDVLPVIFNRLLAAGIDPESITVLVACGTHPPVGEAESAELVGDLPLGVTIRQHSSRDSARLLRVGELRPAVDLRIDREAANTDLLITVGSVRHHYFAGFGGGPKMVFPGIAGHDEIQANHSLVLDRLGGDLGRHPGCEPGVLDGNPVAEEIARAADLRPPDLAVCLVPGRNGGVSWAGAGPWRAAFSAAVAQVRLGFELPGQRFAHLVASGGGRPGDSSLIQAHKGLDAVCRFAAPGAEVLFVAELGDGAGSAAMDPFLADPRPASILEHLAEGYVQYGHTTLRIIEKTSKYRVHLKSSLDPEIARRLGFIPIDDLEEIADRWRDEGFEGRVAVMAEGPVWPRIVDPA